MKKNLTSWQKFVKKNYHLFADGCKHRTIMNRLATIYRKNTNKGRIIRYKEHRRHLRMSRIPIRVEDANKSVVSNITLREFLRLQLPYLEKTTPANTIVNSDGYILVQGSELPTLVLNRNLEMSILDKPIGKPTKKLTTTTDLFKEKLSLKIGTVSFPLISAFCYKFTKIFDVKWIKETLNENEQEELKNYLTLRTNRTTGLLEIPRDSPISKRVNVFSLFQFLGYGSEFLEMMLLNTEQEVKVLLETLLRGWNVENLYDVYEFVKGVSMNDGDLEREIGKLNKDSTKPSKRYLLGLSCEQFDLKSPKCTGSTSRPNSLDLILEEVLGLKNGLFRKLQGVSQVRNFGLLLFLNIWTKTIDNASTTKLPISPEQQFESLRKLMKEKDSETPSYKPIVDTPLINIVGIPVGNYKGFTFPPCVENGLFKLIQVLVFDTRSNRRNGRFLKTTNQQLIDFLNTPGELPTGKWIELVSEQTGIDYNKGGVCDIRSNKTNVLNVMNLLVSGNATSLKEWVDKYVDNSTVEIKADDDKDTITVDLTSIRAIMKIMNGHTEFEIQGLSKMTFPMNKDFLDLYEFVEIIPSFDFIRQLFSFPDKYLEGVIVRILRQREAFEIFNNNDDIFNYFRSLNDVSRAVAIGMTPERIGKGCYGFGFSKLLMNERDFYTIAKILENKLDSLEFGKMIPLNRLTIPPGVKTIEITQPNSMKLTDKGCAEGERKCSPFPDSVVNLIINYPKDDIEPGFLPPNLKTLRLSNCRPIKTPGVFPESLRELTFGNYTGSVSGGILPQKLEILNLGGNYNRPLRKGDLPFTLKILFLSEEFDSEIEPGTLPEGLEYLRVGDSAHKEFITKGLLPKSLKKLILGLNYNYEITPGLLPPNLEVLKLGWFQKISPGALPSSLKTIVLTQATLDKLQRTNIPEGVELVIVNDDEEED